MVCDGYLERLEEQKRLEEQRKREEAIERLKEKLRNGAVQIGKTVNGKEGLLGWSRAERSGFCDPCAFAHLEGSPELAAARLRAKTVQESELHVGH